MDHPVHGDLPDLTGDSPDLIGSPVVPIRSRRSGRRLAAGLAGLSLLLLLAAGWWLRRLAVRPASAPPVLGDYPEFAFPDTAGKVLRKADLRGRIWIADSVPERCPACAVRGLRMADLQASLAKAGNVVLVSFVADSALARPGALAEYAREYGARPGRWLFLAGAPAVSGDRFYVVDGLGRIRGAFPEGDPLLAQEILDAVGALLRERAGAPGVAGRGPFR